MRSSDELIDVANEMRAQMGKLGQPDLETNAVQLYESKLNYIDSWYALRSINGGGPEIITGKAHLRKDSCELVREMMAGYESAESDYTLEASGDKMMEFFNVLVEAIPDMPKYIGTEMPEKVYYHLSDFSGGSLVMVSYQPPSDETKNLQRRAASAFDLAFTRYLDLKNAEEQNRIIQAENERKTEELEEARKLQLGMLPKELPKVDNLDIGVFMKTATEVGGDYYDFSVKEDGTLNIGLGDATGHGMKAGTLVSMMKSLFTGYSAHTELEDFFTTSNKALKNSMLERMMFGFVMINVNRSKVTFINAGMPPLYFYKADKKSVREISQHGLPLGAMKKPTYECNVLTVADGDAILLLSDGMPELQNSKGEMYGYERLKNIFELNAEKSVDEIINCLKDEGSSWVEDKDPDDDVSFIVIKVK
jgi:serine phosphatase RsbU (regulator of sigma subunit)